MLLLIYHAFKPGYILEVLENSVDQKPADQEPRVLFSNLLTRNPTSKVNENWGGL